MARILTKNAIDKVNTPVGRIEIARALRCTEQWVIKMLDRNKANSLLTTVASVGAISKYTGLEPDEITVEVSEPATAA